MTKFVDCRSILVNFISVNSQKTVTPNDLEVHQIKVPSIGQSSHGRAILKLPQKSMYARSLNAKRNEVKVTCC